MVLRILTFVVTVWGAIPAQAQWKTVETLSLKGAEVLIVIPDNWNGSLFLYAHGYTADQRFLAPLPRDVSLANFTTTLPRLLQAAVLPSLDGYAIATTTFRSVGWYVKDAVKDIETLRRYFVKRHGKPKFTYVWGHSGGGMVTAAVIEYAPDRYDGAAPLCGPGAGARRNFNGAFDLRVLYDYICGAVPGAALRCGMCAGSTHRCVRDDDCAAGVRCSDVEPESPAEDGLSQACSDFLLEHPENFSETPDSAGDAFVSPRARACFGNPFGAVPPTPEQLARKDLLLRASQLPENFIETDLFFASIAISEVVHRRTGGKHPWGNIGVYYASPQLTPAEQTALNRGVHRAAADASAVAYMRKWYEPRGRTRSKVITVQALDDGLVIPENAEKYRQAFAAAGRSNQLVQFTTTAGGHCGFISELFPTLDALTAWVERDEKPRLATMRDACPGCTFTAESPGPFGLKVAERRQRGVPVQSVVCDGSPLDCPTGSACRLGRGRCGSKKGLSIN